MAMLSGGNGCESSYCEGSLIPGSNYSAQAGTLGFMDGGQNRNPEIAGE
eukprot:CAMPEP_0114545880 /NCGR_PEP_ID=MMETSP0114-20121206/3644_1 /TAXON_ID=31324 /ORGANISM="Goniomonas sp, Strain m" /LENGTH=48 /DNA_ID= /DNA_START= /DNA_END= /DNA_ORIENTATION=